jgi:hypothetical protein
MSEDVKVALIAVMPLTITAVANLVISIKNSKKLNIVHELTNSNLTKVKKALSTANKKIESLERKIK